MSLDEEFEDLLEVESDHERLVVCGQKAAGVDLHAIFTDAGWEDEADPPTIRSVDFLGGCLIASGILLIDSLFEDLDDWEHTTLEDSPVLARLPFPFQQSYDKQFTRRMVLMFDDLMLKFARMWHPPSCVAQELALRVLFDEVSYLQAEFDLPLPRHWRDILEDTLFKDLGHMALYLPYSNNVMTVNDWFYPHGGCKVNPYLHDLA